MSLPSRPWTALAVAAGLLVTAAAAEACPSSLYPGPAFSYAGADLYAGQAFSAAATGGSDLSACGIPGARGYAADAATMSLHLSMMDGYALTVGVQSDCDSTLLLHTPDGGWVFDDDSGGSLMPELTITGPGRLNGRVDVWIGTYGGGSCPATITFRTARGPGVADEAGDVPQGGAAAGCPNPSLSGQTIAFSAQQLWTRQSLPVQASGSTRLADCGIVGTTGYANPAPAYSFYLSGMQGQRLDLTVDAQCDSTMLVRTPDGLWHFNDDGHGNLDPAISLVPPTALEGRVDVWVGTYGPTPCPATLNLQAAAIGGAAPPPQPQPPVAGAGFGGVWNTDAAGTLTIHQTGASVTGSYTCCSGGQIAGTVSGSVLTGTYIEDNGTDYGTIRFELSPDGRSFTGSYTRTSGSGSGTWNGTRVSGGAMAPQPPQPPTGGRFELVVVPEGITFDQAQLRAQQMGGHLATVTSPEELQAVFAVANNPAAWSLEQGRYLVGPWLGGYRQGSQWMWVTGEPWGFTAWAPGQPDNHQGRETHLNMWVRGTSPAPLLNDADPYVPLRGFVLER
ncbi:hypothetical protein [Roseicyclus persicicus]|uniref:C-type lectin domain-containing protein n=1 Tax=Roseicyclus persicicus TaxID=2650661 RepID=A0A7X6H336_9RHOB|nr:hypothetical protein [Roseibacterium persicicum]NKX46459.1 hypothetical protein [Roseibacterium persicicum]